MAVVNQETRYNLMQKNWAEAATTTCQCQTASDPNRLASDIRLYDAITCLVLEVPFQKVLLDDNFAKLGWVGAVRPTCLIRSGTGD